MTPEQVTIQLTAHEHEIGSLKHRTKRVESQVEAINKLFALQDTVYMELYPEVFEEQSAEEAQG